MEQNIVKIEGPLEKLVDEIASVAGYLWQKGWAERNGGNISADITDLVEIGKDADCGNKTYGLGGEYELLSGRIYIITATQSRMRELPVSPLNSLCIIRIVDKGQGFRVLFRPGEDRMPTSELPAHLGIYKLLREEDKPQKVIVHTHPDELIALTHLKEFHNENSLNHLLWTMHPEIKVVIPEGLGYVPYELPGSNKLGDSTVAKFRKHRIALWEKHGAVAVGRDINEAFDLVDTANKSANIFFLCKSSGYEPEGLSQGQIDELEECFKDYNGAE